MMGTTRDETKAFFWLYTVICVGAHIHLYGRARGRPYYFDWGFLLIVIAKFCLGLIVYDLAFWDDCSGPAGYCPTISCISGNIIPQGYVFMFVILLANAYLNARFMSDERRAARQGQKDVPHYPSCTCPDPDADRYRGVPAAVELTRLAHNAGWLCCPSHAGTPWLSKANATESLLMLGVIFTSLTAILPTIATDPHDGVALEDRMTLLHLIGIGIGALFIGVGGAARLVTCILFGWRAAQRTCGCPDGLCTRGPGALCAKCLPGGCVAVGTSCVDNCNPLFCWWVPKDLVLGPPKWVAGVVVDGVVYVLFLVAGFLFAALANKRDGRRTFRSHYCLKYTTEETCTGSDRDLVASRLAPWPCEWTNGTDVPKCLNPACFYDDNAAEIVFEFWFLAMALMILAAYQCSAHQVLPLDPSEAPPWKDQQWKDRGFSCTDAVAIAAATTAGEADDEGVEVTLCGLCPWIPQLTRYIVTEPNKFDVIQAGGNQTLILQNGASPTPDNLRTSVV